MDEWTDGELNAVVEAYLGFMADEQAGGANSDCQPTLRHR